MNWSCLDSSVITWEGHKQKYRNSFFFSLVLKIPYSVPYSPYLDYSPTLVEYMRMLTAEERESRRWLVLIRSPVQNACLCGPPSITFTNWTKYTFTREEWEDLVQEKPIWRSYTMVPSNLCCNSRRGWLEFSASGRPPRRLQCWSELSPSSRHVWEKIIAWILIKSQTRKYFFMLLNW